VIDATDTAYIDFDVLESIGEFAKEKAASKNIKMTLKGFHERYNFWEADFVHSDPDPNVDSEKAPSK
jgi:carbonic anhydrase